MKVCQATSGGREEEERPQEKKKKVLLQIFSKPVVTVLCEM